MIAQARSGANKQRLSSITFIDQDHGNNQYQDNNKGVT